MHPGLVAACLAVLLPICGCFTPQVLFRAVENRIWLGEFPHGTQQVEIPAPDGSVLRGVFVPGDPGAPVVLHFLESGGSVTKGTQGFPSYQVLYDLRTLGLASLMLDYRGNGVSSGDLSADHLREDARLMWREALRRAGGDPTRVIVRSVSIGTLPAAALIEDGVRPRALLLLAPVRAETAPGHFVDGHFSWPLPWLIKPWMRKATDIDVVAAISHAPCAVLAITGELDAFLPAEEQCLLRAAVARAGGSFESRPGFDHVDIGLASHALQRSERELLAATFPELPMVSARVADALAAAPPAAPLLGQESAASERLARLARDWNPQPPLLAAALAMELERIPVERWSVVMHWLRSLSTLSLAGLSWESMTALVDFDDPCCTLEPREIERLQGFAYSARDPLDGKISVERLVEIAAAERLHERTLVGRQDIVPQSEGGESVDDVQVFVIAEEFEPDLSLPRLQLPPRESLRQVVRLLLKGLAIPERVARDADGALVVEYYDGAAWRALEIPEPAIATSARVSAGAR